MEAAVELDSRTSVRNEPPPPAPTSSHGDGPEHTRAEAPDTNLSVIIPALNEEEGIGPTLTSLIAALPNAEIIVIDDGSTDSTGDVASSIPGVTVVTHPRNRGYGAALKTGMRSTSRELVAWYDADGQHQPQDLIRAVKATLEGPHDLVIGVRGKDSAKQRERQLGKAVLFFIARVISREKIPDLNSGLRCFRRDVLVRYLHLLPDGFSASTTSTLMMMKRGYRVGYVPIIAQARVGKSTVKIVRDGLRTLQLIIRIVVLFEAFKVFTILGLGLFVPGLVYGLGLAFIKHEGFPTLAGTIVVSGLLTFFMGIVADQVVELRKERFEDLPAPARRNKPK